MSITLKATSRTYEVLNFQVLQEEVLQISTPLNKVLHRRRTYVRGAVKTISGSKGSHIDKKWTHEQVIHFLLAVL